MLEHAVREAAGRGADIDAGTAVEIDLPVRERVLEFDSTTADIAKIVTEESQVCIRGDILTRFGDLLLVDEHATRDDQGLRSFARGSKASFDNEFIEPLFHAASG